MNKTFDRYSSLIFLALGAAFVIGSYQISTSSYGSKVGPNIFPMGLGIILILLSLRLFYETFHYRNTEDGKSKLDYKGFLIIFVASVLYALLLEPLGYVISTFLFLLLGFQVMKKGQLWKSLIISAVFSLGVYYLYVTVLQGSLPGLPF